MYYFCVGLPPRYPAPEPISSQRIPGPAEVPGRGSAPSCPLSLLPPEPHRKRFSSSHPSPSLAASKLPQPGKTNLTSHSLKAASKLLPPLLFQVGSTGGFSPLPQHPRKEGGWMGGWVSFFFFFLFFLRERLRARRIASACLVCALPRIRRPASVELSPFISLRLGARWQRDQRGPFTETLE